MRFVVVLVALVACEFRHGQLGVPDDVAPHRDDAAVDGRADLLDARADAQIDAPPPCVTAACATRGGICTSGVCVIDSNLQTGVTCPSGMPCKVICSGTLSCQNGGVDCGMATSCEVDCIGSEACQNSGVDCGTAAKCNVRCIGTNACQNGLGDQAVECRTSVCTVTCDGTDACDDGIDVEAGGMCTSHCCNGGCSSGTDTCANNNVCN